MALVTLSFFEAEAARRAGGGPARLRSVPLPASTPDITVTQMWHPRMEADPAHRWLRALVLAACRRPSPPG